MCVRFVRIVNFGNGPVAELEIDGKNVRFNKESLEERIRNLKEFGGHVAEEERALDSLLCP